jgi:di/tricarboxylate transporter
VVESLTAIVIAVASSAAIITPVATPANPMVMGPGVCRFGAAVLLVPVFRAL